MTTLRFSPLIFFIIMTQMNHDPIYIEQEHAYSGIQVSTAWRLDREMRRRLILQETWFNYSLMIFYFLLYRRRYFLFVSELTYMRVSDDQKYLRSSSLYACRSTRKFKGLDSRGITSLFARYRKSDLYGTSFQSPKITRVLITGLICIQWKFTTPDHGNFAN